MSEKKKQPQPEPEAEPEPEIEPEPQPEVQPDIPLDPPRTSFVNTPNPPVPCVKEKCAVYKSTKGTSPESTSIPGQIEQQNYISNTPPTSAPASAPDDDILPDPIEDPFCSESNPRQIAFESISAASFKIKSGIFQTPCVKSHFQKFSPCNVFLKKEFMQYTGSFKERGTRAALLALSPESRKIGVVAASAGNHAQALAYHGRLLDVPVTVVMPVIAPLMKIQNCRAHGATVLVKGASMLEAKLYAQKIAQDKGAMYINGYDHPDIIAGQGTCGLEILEQVPDVDVIVVPVGGGSLISGIAVAVKTLKPDVKIVGVESSQCLGFTKSLEAGQPTLVTSGPSLADGLAVPLVGFNSFATAAPLIDKMIEVKEDWIALAILRLVELEKCVVEGAGACPAAAVLSGQLDEFQGKNVVLVLSGGNIDTTVLGRVLERGLAADGRMIKFDVEVTDRPGGLQELCFLIGSLGVSIKDILHERAWIKCDVFKTRVKVVCETRDEEHTKQLEEELLKKYDVVHFGSPQQ